VQRTFLEVRRTATRTSCALQLTSYSAQSVLRDAVGFAGCKMIRRVVGIAHVEDFESIADLDARARCELKALLLGRRMLVEAASFSSIDLVVAAAVATRAAVPGACST